LSWVEAAVGPFERLLEAEHEQGREKVQARLEGLRLAYLDLRVEGEEQPLTASTIAAATRGTWVLWMLRQLLSPPVFEQIRRCWSEGKARDDATLRPVAESILGRSLRAFFEFWVDTMGLPSYALRKAEARGSAGSYTIQLEAENGGDGPCPATVVVQTEEGARHSLPLTAERGGRVRLDLCLPTRPVTAAVDPGGDLLMAVGERSWLEVRFRKFWMF
jgi:hypothetical protein